MTRAPRADVAVAADGHPVADAARPRRCVVPRPIWASRADDGAGLDRRRPPRAGRVGWTSGSPPPGHGGLRLHGVGIEELQRQGEPAVGLGHDQGRRRLRARARRRPARPGRPRRACRRQAVRYLRLSRNERSCPDGVGERAARRDEQRRVGAGRQLRIASPCANVASENGAARSKKPGCSMCHLASNEPAAPATLP